MSGRYEMVKILHGSHLYGTNTEKSDLDYKSVFIPSGEEILIGRYKTAKSESTGSPQSKNTKDDVDTCEYSLGRFLNLVSAGDTVCMDMLFAPEDKCTLITDEWRSLTSDLKKHILSKNISAYMGYLRRQASKYGIKGSRLNSVSGMIDFLKNIPQKDKLADHKRDWIALSPKFEYWEYDEECLSVCGRKQPWGNRVELALECYEKVDKNYGERARQAQNNEGVDWKAIHHATRAGFQILELLNTGHITFPRPERELLLSIKKEERAFRECSERLERLVEDIEVARNNSSLPEQPNRVAIEEFLIRQYKKQVMG